MGSPTYLADNAKLPYCRGCGHALVVRQLSQALERLVLPPRSVALTTDIGCVGLADSLFPFVHTVHTTHGRSTAMAVGMALAEAVLPDGGLKPVVMIGDGGAMIGLLHLIHAAQLNVDITVLVHNNFLFGMTGGQHSAFTPLDWITSTTPEGNLIPPLDLLEILRTAHAGFLARQFATDSDLGAVIADAVAFPGFSLVEILEICTGYGALRNKTTGNVLREVASRQGSRVVLVAAASTPSRSLSPLEPAENLELALCVCEAAGVSRATAMTGMQAAVPDVGALRVERARLGAADVTFVNAFSVNDVESLQLIWRSVLERGVARAPVAVLLNGRGDRPLRSVRFGEVVAREIDPERLLLTGDGWRLARRAALRAGYPDARIVHVAGSTEEQLLECLAAHVSDGATLLGVGNFQGAGPMILSRLEHPAHVC